MDSALSVSDPTAIAQAVEAWQSELDVSERTKECYRRSFKAFYRWTDRHGVAVNKASRADLLAYRSYLTDRYAPATARAYFVAVRSFYEWVSLQIGTPAVTAGIKTPKVRPSHARDALTKSQVQAVLDRLEERAETNSLEALRDAALVRLLVVCGLRTCEAASADVGDVRVMGERRVLWVKGKGRDAKDAYVVLPDSVSNAIDRYLTARESPKATDPLFCGHANANRGGYLTAHRISRICKAALIAAGINSPRITAHSLRHTAATAALMDGATIQQAQAMLRHARIDTTAIYAHDLERLADPAEDRAEHYLSGLSR